MHGSTSCEQFRPSTQDSAYAHWRFTGLSFRDFVFGTVNHLSPVNTELLDCFMGGLPALDTLSRFTGPQIIPHELAFGETCTFVHAVHRPSLL
jgi:hypothetical protein